MATLNIYLLGMVLAAVDYPLNFAFYPRNNTLLPALVGVASVVVYTVVALTLVTPLGYLGLVWADTAKQGAHVVIMVLLLWRTLGRLNANTIRGYRADCAGRQRDGSDNGRGAAIAGRFLRPGVRSGPAFHHPGRAAGRGHLRPAALAAAVARDGAARQRAADSGWVSA